MHSSESSGTQHASQSHVTRAHELKSFWCYVTPPTADLDNIIFALALTLALTLTLTLAFALTFALILLR